MFHCSYSPYPCNSKPLSSVYPLNWSCLYHVFTIGCLYIYYVHPPNAGYVQHLLFPIPFCHATLPTPLPISTRPTSSRWVPPYVPWFCFRCLADYQGVFSCPCCQCACTKGVQALGSVKRLETIVLLWRYINTIE